MRPIQSYEVTVYRNQTVKYTVDARTPEEAESIVETLDVDEGQIVESGIDSVDVIPVEDECL